MGTCTGTGQVPRHITNQYLVLGTITRYGTGYGHKSCHGYVDYIVSRNMFCYCNQYRFQSRYGNVSPLLERVLCPVPVLVSAPVTATSTTTGARAVKYPYSRVY